MKLTAIQPILYSKDIEESIIFYCEVLGFRLISSSENLSWVRFQKDEVQLMVSKAPDSVSFSKPIFTGSLYMVCEDVSAIWEALKNTVEVCYELEDFEWGMREFGIYDNNGYVLQFGEEIK
ncbi:VOC family protein [Sphingobacterium cellulitidis]|uniref:VOC family protein n=1 Tax=Sphingobacterium cellulitidis TaxID=1768011 RepID=UPI000B93AA34|nr:hypothetical protein CHT99_15915 [Sphingobacterium cellulitidis]